MRLYKRAQSGFTLAELLIALAILGVIATFTIPKILNATGTAQNTAIAKEAASMVSGAFSEQQLTSGVTTATTAGVFLQYMNYVSLGSGTTVQTDGAACTSSLTAGIDCLKLHNGGVLSFNATNSPGSNTTTGAWLFNIDPDGSGAQTGATLVQYYSGRFTTYQQAGSPVPTTTTGVTPFTTDPAYIQNFGN